MSRILSTEPLLTLVPLLALVLALSACDGTPADVDPLGSWGGEGIALLVSVAGGELEFDCAVGTIDEPVADPGGGFTLVGTFTLGFGGPAIEGQEPEVRPATWTGSISGDRMTLGGRFGDDDTPLGPYQLRKGEDPLLRKCL